MPVKHFVERDDSAEIAGVEVIEYYPLDDESKFRAGVDVFHDIRDMMLRKGYITSHFDLELELSFQGMAKFVDFNDAPYEPFSYCHFSFVGVKVDKRKLLDDIMKLESEKQVKKMIEDFTVTPTCGAMHYVVEL